DSIIARFPDAYQVCWDAIPLQFWKGNYDRCAFYLYKLAETGYQLNETYWSADTLFFSEENANTIKEKVPGFYNKYQRIYYKTVSNYNYDYNIALIKIHDEDQSIRFLRNIRFDSD